MRSDARRCRPDFGRALILLTLMSDNFSPRKARLGHTTGISQSTCWGRPRCLCFCSCRSITSHFMSFVASACCGSSRTSRLSGNSRARPGACASHLRRLLVRSRHSEPGQGGVLVTQSRPANRHPPASRSACCTEQGLSAVCAKRWPVTFAFGSGHRLFGRSHWRSDGGVWMVQVAFEPAIRTGSRRCLCRRTCDSTRKKLKACGDLKGFAAKNPCKAFPKGFSPIRRRRATNRKTSRTRCRSSSIIL